MEVTRFTGTWLARQFSGESARFAVSKTLQAAFDRFEIVELIHAFGSAFQLTGGLRTSQQQHAQQRHLAVAEAKGFPSPVAVLRHAVVASGENGRQLLRL